MGEAAGGDAMFQLALTGWELIYWFSLDMRSFESLGNVKYKADFVSSYLGSPNPFHALYQCSCQGLYASQLKNFY